MPAAQLHPRDLPISLAFQHLWWDGVRVLLNMVASARRSARLIRAVALPSRFLRTLSALPRDAAMVNFDILPTPIRLDLLLMIDWLVTDWPARFIDAMSTAGINWSDFAAAEIAVPFWLSDVTTSLRQRTYRVSIGEVEAAASALTKQNGPSSSKNRLKKLLGVTESDALNGLLPVRHPRLSDQGALRLAEIIDADLSTVRAARGERDTLLKDASCIAIAVWNCIGLSNAARYSMDAVERSRGEWRKTVTASQDLQRAAVSFDRWLDEYLSDVRPTRLLRGENSSAAFLTRFGKPCGGNGLAPRFSSLLRRLGIAEWERGARLLVNRAKHQ